MNNNKFHIAYCIDNQDIAQDIDNHLSRVGIQIEHVMISNGTDELPLRDRLKDIPDYILLLVSDNFLKNMNCMNRGLFMIQELILHQRAIPIITDGRYKKEGSDEIETVPTEFDRMNQVIKFMNYWQDLYLDLRKKRRDIPKEALDTFDERLKIVRAISSEMGEFLKVLKNNSHWDFQEMKANAYELFFHSIEKPGLHEALQEAINDGEIPQVTTTPPPSSFYHSEEKKSDDHPTNSPQEEIPETEKEKDFSLVNEIYQEEELPNTSSNISEEDQKILKISEENLKKKGKVPLLDKLIQHRKQDVITEENQPTENQENKDEVFENAVNRVVEEEKLEALAPHQNDSEQVLRSIFHDEEELDASEMISNFKLSTEQPEENQKKVQNDHQDATWRKQWAEAKKIIKTGNTEAGLDLMELIMKKNPKNVDLKIAYARQIIQDKNKVKRATKELKSALKIDKKNVETYLLLAKAEEVNGDYLLAKNYLEKALSLEKDNPKILYLLGVLIYSKFPDLKDQATVILKELLQIDPSNSDAHYRYALLQDEHLKKPKKAIRHYKKTRKLEPTHPLVNYDLALLFYRLGKFKKAAKYYKKACRINPEFRTETNNKAFLGSKKFKKRKKEADLFKELDEDLIHTTFEASDELPISFEDRISPKNPNLEKIVLISGATSGIGKATATLFAKNGFRIIITGRRANRLSKLKKEFEKNYPTKVKTLKFDVRKMKAAQAAINSLDEKWKSIDILINNAGLAKGFEAIHEGKLEDWETMIDTNVKGLLYLTRIVSPGMVARKKGHIINVCSTAGHEVYPKGNVYCATKHAVDALTKGMRLDLYQHGLRVSQVSPAHVEETEFARVRFDWDVERAKIYEDFQPLRSEDVANTIYFIATQPEHVNIQDVLIMGKQQANSTNIDRSGR